jgi:uncharacterized protein (TIGR02996 family)
VTTKKKGFSGLSELRTQVRDATSPLAGHGELEAAIEAQPDDRATYLVYADALERAGDPRGKWITLNDAVMQRPDDAELARAMAAYLEEHELYLLGELATEVRSKAVEVRWAFGFVRSLRVAHQPTAKVVAIVEAIAKLPACRFLRELVIARHYQLDAKAVTARLVALARPATLAMVDIASQDWVPSKKLREAFPRLDETVVAFEDLLARVRMTPVQGEIDWFALPRLAEWQVRERFAAVGERLTEPDPRIGMEVDPAVFVDGGGVITGGGKVADIVVSDLPGCVIVEGNLEIDGVLEQPFRSAPMIVFGNVHCRGLCTDGYLVVMGDLVVDDVFYGCCTNYMTIVFGAVRVGTLLLDKNHHFGAHGEVVAETELSDEEDGYDAIPDHLAERGLVVSGGLSASTLAAALRAR